MLDHQWFQAEHKKQKGDSGVNRGLERNATLSIDDYSWCFYRINPLPSWRNTGCFNMILSVPCFAPHPCSTLKDSIFLTCHTHIYPLAFAHVISFAWKTFLHILQLEMPPHPIRVSLKLIQGERDLKSLWTIRWKLAHSLPMSECTLPLLCIKSCSFLGESHHWNSCLEVSASGA